jgi:hypothetical protein
MPYPVAEVSGGDSASIWAKGAQVGQPVTPPRVYTDRWGSAWAGLTADRLLPAGVLSERGGVALLCKTRVSSSSGTARCRRCGKAADICEPSMVGLPAAFRPRPGRLQAAFRPHLDRARPASSIATGSTASRPSATSCALPAIATRDSG